MRGVHEYTIDNRMEYRDVAKDLIPDNFGRLRGKKEGRTAPLNWYRTYLEGGGLQTTLACWPPIEWQKAGNHEPGGKI